MRMMMSKRPRRFWVWSQASHQLGDIPHDLSEVKWSYVITLDGLSFIEHGWRRLHEADRSNSLFQISPLQIKRRSEINSQVFPIAAACNRHSATTHSEGFLLQWCWATDAGAAPVPSRCFQLYARWILNTQCRKKKEKKQDRWDPLCVYSVDV